MLARCFNPKTNGYERYGGRGITVCERWRGPDGFENFLADMGERPAGMTLDRRDNDGNYELGNCRWATLVEQARDIKRVDHALIVKLYAGGKSAAEVAIACGTTPGYVRKLASRARREDRGAGIRQASQAPTRA